MKVDAKSSKDEVATSRAKDMPPLRKKLALPFDVIKSSSKNVPSTENMQVGTAPSSFAKVKHLVRADSKKISGMGNVRDTPLKYPTDNLRNCNLPCKEIRSQTSSLIERQRDIDIPPQISSHLYRKRDKDRTGRTTLPPNLCDLVVELRAVKHEANSVSLTLLEARMTAAKKAKESFARAKGSSELRIAVPEVDKSNSA